MRKGLAQGLLYGGAFTALGSVFAELATVQTWADVLTPSHVFGSLGALAMAAGALFSQPPGTEP